MFCLRCRYHYFLQCKSDVIDGKLNCSIDQAISLAAYSLQGEFGDFDPGLVKLCLIPKSINLLGTSTRRFSLSVGERRFFQFEYKNNEQTPGGII